MRLIRSSLEQGRAVLSSVDAWRVTTFVVFLAVFLMGPTMQEAFAGAFNRVICNAVNLVTTDAAKAIATAAVITIAIGALLGRVSWGMAVMIGVGIAALFAAPNIAAFISTGTWGGDAGYCKAGTP